MRRSCVTADCQPACAGPGPSDPRSWGRSEKGQVIDIAMIDGISVLMIHLAGRMQMGQWSEQRGGNLLDGSAYFYRCYQTAEGRYVSVGAIEKPFHGEFLRTLGEDPGDYPAYLDPHRWPERSSELRRLSKPGPSGSGTPYLLIAMPALRPF